MDVIVIGIIVAILVFMWVGKLYTDNANLKGEVLDLKSHNEGLKNNIVVLKDNLEKREREIKILVNKETHDKR